MKHTLRWLLHGLCVSRCLGWVLLKIVFQATVDLQNQICGKGLET